MDRTHESCGWGKQGSSLCMRKRRAVYGGECASCRYWVKRLYIDRFRSRRERRGRARP